MDYFTSFTEHSSLTFTSEVLSGTRKLSNSSEAIWLSIVAEDTRIRYSLTPHLSQTIELPQTEHDDFDQFIFGFTGGVGAAASQSAVITDFKLSFIRPNDPIAP